MPAVVLQGPSFWVGIPRLHSGKEPAANAGDIRGMGSIPGLARFPGVGNDSQLQYSIFFNILILLECS